MHVFQQALRQKSPEPLPAHVGFLLAQTINPEQQQPVMPSRTPSLALHHWKKLLLLHARQATHLPVQFSSPPKPAGVTCGNLSAGEAGHSAQETVPRPHRREAFYWYPAARNTFALTQQFTRAALGSARQLRSRDKNSNSLHHVADAGAGRLRITDYLGILFEQTARENKTA